jgi:hypothetical protein
MPMGAQMGAGFPVALPERGQPLVESGHGRARPGATVRGDCPDADRKAAWHKVLQADLDRGVTTSRVHAVCSPLSDYLRYELEWGYAHNLAYEDIRILDLSEKPMPTGLDGIGDFWLIDDLQVAVMRYDGTRPLPRIRGRPRR